MEIENELSHRIIGCAIEVHKILGAGLLESAYQECFLFELKREGLDVKSEVVMPIYYKNTVFSSGYRMDILVNNKVVVELKSVESFSPVHIAQVLTYLKLGNFKLGLLLNFNVTSMRDGIKRVIL